MRRNPVILFIASFFFVSLWLLPRDLSAQPDYKKAAEHYKDAEQAMESSQFELAAREYGIAFEITKDPVLFYKIADANDKAGNCAAALIYYGRYLKEGNPDEKFKALTTERIAHCNDVTAGGTKPAGGGDASAEPAGGGAVEPGDGSMLPPTGDGDGAGGDGTGGDDTAAGGGGAAGGGPSFLDDKPSWKMSAAWISVGAAVALATAGAVLGLSASSREEDVSNLIAFRDSDGQPATFEGNTRDRYQQLTDEGKDFNTYSRVAFAAAGAATAAAIAFFVLDLTEDKGSSEAIGAMVTEDGGGVTAAWSF